MSEAQAQVSNTPKTTIRPNTEGMIKTATGSFHKDDPVGNLLAGLNLDQVKEVATIAEIDVAKYGHLNVGQQRMNIGNKLRGVLAKDENGNIHAKLSKTADKHRAANEKLAADAEKAKEAEKAARVKAAAEADKAKLEAKQKADAEKKAKKEADAKAKADAEKKAA